MSLSRPISALLPPTLRFLKPAQQHGRRAFSTEQFRTGMGEGQRAAGNHPPGHLALGLEAPAAGPRVWITRFLQFFLPVAGITTITYGFMYPDSDPLIPTKLPPQLAYMASQQTENDEVITNWSGTHEMRPRRLFQPENEVEVEQFLRAAHGANQKLRVVGSAISPNGMSLCEEGMLSMSLMDKIVKVDKEKMQVTVQSGCRVQQVADALKEHGLTLQNFASIREQQIGGFTQVGAHGTGAKIPPVDEQVIALNLVTPTMGVIKLSKTEEPELFGIAKVGLGGLGVVTELTLQCVPRHELVEKTFTVSTSEVKKNHVKWLQDNQHLRYMWIPYTDSVVVVQCNPKGSPAADSAAAGSGKAPPSQADALKPLRNLLTSKTGATKADIEELTSTQLRDALLAVAPLNTDWVTSVNKAEAEFWKLSSGTRVGYSDEILGFDCGGQQWVLETAFPVGSSLSALSGQRTKDLEYMETLLTEIKKNKIPAPSPIEQRWTSGSSSPMSPAAGSPESVHSWVGTIMYLPEEAEARAKITESFRSYAGMVQDRVMPKYGAVWHWAKLEVPTSPCELKSVRAKLAARYPVKEYNAYRTLLDPRNILANEWLDALFPK